MATRQQSNPDSGGMGSWSQNAQAYSLARLQYGPKAMQQGLRDAAAAAVRVPPPAPAPIVRSGGGGGGYSGGRTYRASSGGGGGGRAYAAAPAPAPVPVNPMVGPYASRYTEPGAMSFIKNPELMLNDLLSQKYGAAQARGMYGMLEPYANRLNPIYFAQQGQRMDSGTVPDFTNWLGEQWTNMQTPGKYTDVNLGLRNVMSPGGGSPLHSYLAGGSFDEQVDATSGVVNALLAQGYHPMFASAAADQVERAGIDYLSRAATGESVPNFVDYLNRSVPTLTQLR